MQERVEEQARPAFRDATDLATAAMVALAAIALLYAGLFAYAVARDGGVPPKAIRDLQILLHVAAAAAFIAWLHRVYANVEALYGETAHERFWAVAGFFVPPYLAYRPCEITAEAWRRSSRDEEPYFVYAWWTALVLTPVLALLGRKPMAQLIGIAAAGLAIYVIRAITTRQLAARNALAASSRAAALAERRSRLAGTPPPADVIPSAGEGSGRVGHDDAHLPPGSLDSARDDMTPPPPPPPQIAPHLAAMDAANAQRAAERRATMTGVRLPPVETPAPSTTPPPPPPPPASPPPAPRPNRPDPSLTLGITKPSHDDVWARILSVTVSIGALTMLAVALAIMVQPESRAVAVVYGAFALVLLILALIIGRHRVEAKIAIFGMAVVAANIIVAIGAAVR